MSALRWAAGGGGDAQIAVASSFVDRRRRVVSSYSLLQVVLWSLFVGGSSGNCGSAT